MQPVRSIVDVLEEAIIDGNFILFVGYFFEHQKNNCVDFFKNKFKITPIVSKATFHFFIHLISQEVNVPKKKAIDKKKLVKMIKDETPQPEIMSAFGFKTSTQLRNAYMNALIEEGAVAPIKSGRKSSKPAAKKEINVGKTGSLIIPKGIVSEMGFTQNDTFSVRKTKAGISLKKM